MHNQAPIQRRKSKRIYVGNVPIGDGAPIAVQSMTNTRTTDVEATVNQIKALERVGADIVRVSVPTMDAAEAFKLIKQQVSVPLVADIHFDYRIALKVAEYGVDCLRINPGNIGNEERIRMVVDCARDKNIPIRIGVNAGSLEKDLQEKYGEPTPQALLESAMRHVDHLDRLNFDQFKVSVKASDVFLAVESYRLLAKQIDQPLHLGITEAGGLRSGSVKSAIGLGLLLSEGIGDTLRVSLAADPVEEIKVGFDILKSLRIRARGINFIACPTCSRQEFDVIGTVNALEQRLEDIITPMDVSIIGCGPIGILLMQSCKALGAAKVLITDISDYRLELAKSLGADYAINTAKVPYADAIAEVFGPDKADVTYECAGNNATTDMAIQNSRKGSVIVLVAVFADWAKVDLARLNDSELTLDTSMMYRHEDYVDALRFVAEGKIQLKPLISKHFAFRDFLSAYQYIDANRERTMKVVVDIQD